MIKFWGKRKTEILQQYFNSSKIICRDYGEEVSLHKEKMQKIFKEIYLTRFSFIYIVLGYLLCIFEVSVSKCYAVLTILSISSIEILLAYVISVIICQKRFSKDIKIPYDEAVEKGNATQVMSSKEFDELWETTWAEPTDEQR